MEIVVIPNYRAPVVTHMVWYKAGAADETAGKSGIAHFMEHLMFKGSRYFDKEGTLVTLEPGEFSLIVKGLGGQDNAFTSQDYTAYFQSVPVTALEKVMRMEAGRMRSMALPPAEVISENKVILEERRQRTDNNPQAKFGEQMDAALFVNHPYSIPVIGWEHEMATLNRDDAKEFYDRYYYPNNAILIVSGDITGEQIHKLAQEIYGPIQAGDIPKRTRTIAPPLFDNVTIQASNPALRQPVVQMMVKAPSYRTSRKDAYALQVLEEIMSGGPTSRFYKSLVVNQKIASGAGLSYRPNAWDETQLWVYASPLPKHQPQEIKNALDEELRLLIRDGVTAEELNGAITRMQDNAVYALDSLSGPAMIFGQAIASGTQIDDIEYWPVRIAEVTAEDVQAVAKKYINPDAQNRLRFVTGYLLPDYKAAPQKQRRGQR